MSSATILKTLALALSLSPLPALAQVNFNIVAIDQPLTISELQAAAQATTSAFVGGVEMGPGNDLFVIHNDGFGEETFLQIDPASNVVSLRRTATQVAADLGAPYTSAFTPVGEFTWDRNRGAQGTLYFADNSVAGPPNFDEFALIAIDVATGTASEVLRSNTIAAWNSHGVLSDGQIVGTLGEDIEILVPGEEPQTGLVNPLAVTPSWELKFEEDDYKALIVPPLPLGAHLPPETIGVDPRNDDVYVFCHDELEIFRIDDIASVAPTLTRIDVPGWTGVVDLHGLSVDEDGNVYGFDEAAESIVVWNGAATFSVPFTDVETALGSAAPFGVTTWRGMKARKISPTQSEVVMASNSADYGLVRIVFGNAPAIDVAAVSVDEPLTIGEIESAIGAADTSGLDAVALGAGRDVFIVHRDLAADETFARLDLDNKQATWQRSAAQVATDLGAPYTSAFTMVGEFVFDENVGSEGTLYLADNSTAGAPNFDEFSLLSIDVAADAAAEVLRSNTIAAWNSHGLLSSGQIVGTLGEDIEILVPGEEPKTGLVNPADVAPAFSPVYDEDDYKALIVPPPAGHMPPETIGVDPRNDDVYVFCHDELELFRIDNIEATPSLTHLTIPGWTGVVDLHGLAVDERGLVVGFDEAAESITWWDGTSVNAITFDAIQTALGGATAPAPAVWRGMKTRVLNDTQTEVWLANSTADYGLIRLVIGNAPADVDSDDDGFTDEFEKLVGSNAFLASVKPTLGDVDTNGSISGADAAKIAQAVAGNTPAAPYDATRADVDGNGVVNVADVTLLANFNAGLISTLR